MIDSPFARTVAAGARGRKVTFLSFLRPKSCREKSEMSPSLIAYFPLADAIVPTHLLDLYADAGVDIVEFGWPARDPYLDGVDVRASMARAAQGDPRAALTAACERLSSHRKAPKVVIMTYAEPDHPPQKCCRQQKPGRFRLHFVVPRIMPPLQKDKHHHTTRSFLLSALSFPLPAHGEYRACKNNK